MICIIIQSWLGQMWWTWRGCASRIDSTIISEQCTPLRQPLKSLSWMMRSSIPGWRKNVGDVMFVESSQHLSTQTDHWWFWWWPLNSCHWNTQTRTNTQQSSGSPVIVGDSKYWLMLILIINIIKYSTRWSLDPAAPVLIIKMWISEIVIRTSCSEELSCKWK